MPVFMPMRFATGPLTTMIGLQGTCCTKRVQCRLRFQSRFDTGDD